MKRKRLDCMERDQRYYSKLADIMRETLGEYESIAFHNKLGLRNQGKIKLAYNAKVKQSVWQKYNILTNLGRDAFFENIFAVKDYLISWENNGWQILTIFTCIRIYWFMFMKFFETYRNKEFTISIFLQLLVFVSLVSLLSFLFL